MTVVSGLEEAPSSKGNIPASGCAMCVELRGVAGIARVGM